MVLSNKQIIKEIKNGKNIEKNVEIFGNELSDCYYNEAIINLSFDYYTLYEMYYDKSNTEFEKNKVIILEVTDILKKALLSDFDVEVMEQSVVRLYELRKNIVDNMNVITFYIDALTIYEYVLNRIDGRFNENLFDLDDGLMVDKIVKYIFDTKDNIIINDKIKEIMGELPVRMTKTRFFDLVRDSISTYKGSDKSSLENYLYILKSSSMIYRPEGIDELYPSLKELVKKLSDVDYSNLDKEEHSCMVKELHENANFLKARVDVYVMLINIINNMYAAVLMSPYSRLNNSNYEKEGKEILEVVYEHFKMGINEDIIEKCEENLIKLEGVPEHLHEKVELLEGTFYEIGVRYKELIEELMLDKMYKSLETAQKLLSGSMFVDLENEEHNEEEADDTYIKEISNEIIKDFKGIFEKNHKMVNRAIMASIMNKMPVFFLNSEEAVNYISNAFYNCSDKDEKRASKHIINQIIEEYNYYFEI